MILYLCDVTPAWSQSYTQLSLMSRCTYRELYLWQGFVAELPALRAVGNTAGWSSAGSACCTGLVRARAAAGLAASQCRRHSHLQCCSNEVWGAMGVPAWLCQGTRAAVPSSTAIRPGLQDTEDNPCSVADSARARSCRKSKQCANASIANAPHCKKSPASPGTAHATDATKPLHFSMAAYQRPASQHHGMCFSGHPGAH